MRADYRLPSRKIKVAIVLMYFGYGGAERMVALLASHLDLDRFDVRVFCIYGEPQNNVMEQMVTEHGVEIVYLGKGKGFSPKYVLMLSKLLSEFGADVVHTHLNAVLYCVPWFVGHKGRGLHTLHNMPIQEAGKRLTLMKLLFRMGFVVPVAISEENRRLTADCYRLKRARVETVLNPVDTSLYFQRDCSTAARFDVIHIARLAKQKDQKLLLQAFRLVVDAIPQARLAIVGDGPDKEVVVHEIVTLGLSENVFLLGRRDDIPELLSSSSVFCLSSLYEGLPMSILEAMAAGLPIVSTDVGGIADVVSTNGILVPPRDANALAKALEKLLGNEELLKQMSKKSLELVKRYDIETIADKYEYLYEKLAKN